VPLATYRLSPDRDAQPAKHLRGIVTDDGEEMTFCRFANDLELFIHPDDVDHGLDLRM
jgi:hypothetical protein